MNICDGIHNWAYIIARLQGAAGCGYQEDWVGMSADLAGAAGKTMWYLRNQIFSLKDAIKKVTPTATYVVDIAMVVTQFLDFLNGFWIPDTGESLVHGEEQLKTLYYTLLLACPDENQWSGDKEKYYAGRNLAQLDQVQKMRELDTQLRGRIHQQAVDVQSAHTFIAVTLFWLLLAQGIALALCLIPETGSLISWRFQIAVATSAVSAVVAKEIYTGTQAAAHAHAIDDIADEYHEVAVELQRSSADRRAAWGAMARSAVSIVDPTFGGPRNVSGALAHESAHPGNGSPMRTADELIATGRPELAQLVSLLEQFSSGQRVPDSRQGSFVTRWSPAVPQSSSAAGRDQPLGPADEAGAAGGVEFGVADLTAAWDVGHREETHPEVA